MLSTASRSGLRRLFSTRSKLRGSAAVVSTAALVGASVVVAAPAMAAPPANDNFANATVITGSSGTITGTTVDSTGETGEPAPGGTPIKSIWYSWVAPSATQVSFDTCTSSYDTTMGAYTGTTVSTLTTIVENDQATALCSGTDQSRISFTPVSGTTYKIKIDGFFGTSGTTRLTWSQTAVVAPVNDNFANAITLTPPSGTVSGTNVGATGQTGEPINVSTGPIRSVWYKYTPTSSGTLTVSLCTSTSFDSAIGIYTGTAVNALTKLASDDDGCGTTAGPSRISSFAVTSGTTYNISIDGYQGATSTFSMSYTFTAGGPAPANDNLASAIALSGASGSVTGTTVNATGQTSEVRVSGTSATAKSVWYSWVAPSSGSATFGLCTGTTFDTLLAAYTGTSHPLTSIASADDTTGCGSDIQSRITFNAVAGTSYKIQVDGFTNTSGVTASGAFTLTYSLAVPLTLSIDDVTLNEGNAGTTNFTFTVSLSAASASTVTVNYAAANGTATSPADYAPTSGSLSFTAGQVSKTVTVPVVGDVTFEPTETFFVNLSGATGATIADSSGLGTISNDDNQPGVSIGDVTQAEGDSGSTTFSFPVTLSNPSANAVSLSYATANNTATAPSDYTAASGTLTFNAGETSKNVSVTVSGDTLFEVNETFFVNLSGLSGGTFSDNQAVGTISNDDATPTLSIGDVTHDEGNAGTTTYTFTVGLSSASGEPVTVDYASSDASATALTDYQGVTGTLTFNPGQTSKTITVLVNGDTTYETDETFSVDLANAIGAGIADSSGLGTINNDDAAPAFAIDDVTGTEGDAGTTEFEFTVTRTSDTELASTVDYSTADGTAESPADYAATSGTLTFAPGDSTATVTVEVNGDNIDEVAESFTVTLSGATGATISDDEGTGTITDDDPTPAVTIDDVSQVELDGAATSTFDFTVSLSRPSSRSVTVDYATTDGTASEPTDYAAATGTLTFDPGETTQTVSVTVNGDGTNEPNETFFVDLSNAVRANIADARGVGTILNDDGQATLSIDDVTHTEGDSGNTAYTFTVSLSGSTALISTVNYDTNNGTATAPGDYTATNGTLTFAPGQTSQQVTVQVHGDTTYEDDEDFTVHLSNAVGATIGDANGVGTISNDDAFPELSIADASDDEGTGGTTPFDFVLTLSNPSEQTITVDYATADGTATAPADYATRTGSLTFAPGQTTKTVTVPVVGDATYENDEQFSVQLANAVNVTLVDADAVGSVNDDDAPPSFTIGNVSHVEGDSGTTSYEFTVTLTGASALPATVDYATANGSATAGEDYAPVTGTLTFAPGETSKTVTVEVSGDLTFEANETFSVLLTQPADATISDGTGAGTIQNDDSEPTVSIGNETQAEGDTGTRTFTFDVTLSNPSSETVTVEVDTADGTATAPSDYNVAGGTVTFAPGEVVKTVSVTVKGDVVFEGNETFTVELSAPNNATIGDGTGVGTINNDDNQPVISISDAAVIEGNTGTKNAVFTVALTNPSAQSVTVDYATNDGSAEELIDYFANTGTLTFAPGQTSQTVTVLVRGDTTFETDETFDVDLSNPVRATISDDTGVGTITDDDFAPNVSIADATVTEGDSGTQPLVFQLTLSNASYQTVTVAYETSDGTAVEPGDYTAEAGTVSFQPGQTAKIITVDANGDLTYETDETFSVDLGNATNGGIAVGHADGTINDNDNVPTLSIDDETRPEGDSGATNFGFTVSLTGATEVDASVSFTTSDGTAVAPGDYAAQSNIITVRAGETSASIDVAVKGDTVVELDETFSVLLSSPQDAAISDGTGLGTILNDDSGGCTISGTPGNDTLTGTAGNDVICGAGGNDIIDGLGGNDELRGEGGDDVLVGGPGNDAIIGGTGLNTVTYATDPIGVQVSLANGTATDGFGGSDTIASVGVVRGSAFADTIIGSSAADQLFGLNGADRFKGSAGDDLINGGRGSDAASAGQGTDSCPSVETRKSCESTTAAASGDAVGSGQDVLPWRSHGDLLFGRN